MERLSIQVWSDIACPWCYVGKRRLEAAIARMSPALEADVVWRAFELDRDAPRIRLAAVSYAERLARKYGTSRDEAEGMIERMTAVAAGDGLVFRFDRIQSGNTFDAHRLLHLARDRGRQPELKERLFRAYFTEGEAIGDLETLARLSIEAGLEREDATRVLTTDAYAAAVRDDEAEAHRLGIHGVPFFVLAGRLGVSGAQPVEVLVDALGRARAEAQHGAVAGSATCGPDGCEGSGA